MMTLARTALVACSLLLTLPALAQSEGPYRASQAQGFLSKPAQAKFVDLDLKKLKTPKGAKVEVFARDLGDPRMMVVGTDGAVYVSRPKEGSITILRDTNADGVSDSTSDFVTGFEGVHGMAIDGGKLYFVARTKVYAANLKGDPKPNLIIPALPDVGQHENRSLAIGPDRKLYIEIASNCNACVDPNKKMATMRRFNLDGTAETTFATGLRDTIGFDWHPATQELYGLDHGTDWRGDKFPPEELNLIIEGKDYGWPFCYGDRKADNNLIDNPKGETAKEKYCETKTESPKLVIDAHSAPIAMKFYNGEMFSDLKGSAIAALHGSWNRKNAVGYKVIAIKFENGKPAKIEDFLSGFLAKDGRSQFGRPAGLAVLADGSILVSDDSSGIVYRISR